MPISRVPHIESVDFRDVLQQYISPNQEATYGSLSELLHESAHFF